MANPVGRPKEHDRIQVGKDFVQWALDHPDCLTVPHFTTAHRYSTSRLLEWCDEDPEFRQYYMQAKEIIGINRLNATNNINNPDAQIKLDKTIYLRHVGNFDPDKRKFDREEKAYEASLKQPAQEHNHTVIYQTNYQKDDPHNPIQILP